jgi:N-acyl-D-amino-acid deacylase
MMGSLMPWSSKRRPAAAAGLLSGVSALALVALPSVALTAAPADLLIQGGTVYTGADAPGAVADVVVVGDKIVYVGPAAARRYSAKRVINAKGKIVAPGLIDAHTHPDTYIRSADARQRLNAPWVFQGVSTVLMGVDGYGTPDVAKDAAWFTEKRVGTNLVPYVGFGAVRSRVLNQDARAPTPAELDKERALVAKGMCEGAIGFSTGLFYAPQSFAKTDEVIELAKEAGKRGGLYDTHQRDESSYTIGLLGSVKEVIQIGREAGLPVHFAHIKALGVDVQGEAPQVIALINQARAAGQVVTADEYPWEASGSSLDASLLPRWSVDGGRPALLKRLDDPATLEKIRTEMAENMRRRGGPDSLLLTAADKPWTGKTLAQMAKTWNLDPRDAALRIIRDNGHGTSVASFNMVEPDIKAFMVQPWVVTSSDGSDGHPRQYATFPMKYAKYVKAEKTITLGEFIRSSTGRTADMFKLKARGYLKPGYFADVVVFDPDRYAPKADYVHPRLLTEGVDELVVNGALVLDGGKLTGQAPGRVLLRTPPAGTCA